MRRALAEIVAALAGPGRPAPIVATHALPGEVVVELEPTGRALALVLAVIDTTLAATPGRTSNPSCRFRDDVLRRIRIFTFA